MSDKQYCPDCQEDVSHKQTPTGRPYCPSCGLVLGGEKPRGQLDLEDLY